MLLWGIGACVPRIGALSSLTPPSGVLLSACVMSVRGFFLPVYCISIDSSGCGVQLLCILHSAGKYFITILCDYKEMLQSCFVICFRQRSILLSWILLGHGRLRGRLFSMELHIYIIMS